MARVFWLCIALIPVSAITQAADSPLSRKVSYESSGKRLHTVADELSKATKVLIASGRRSTDWQSRDVPIIVSVRDIALIDLLQSIADCGHLAFTKDKQALATDPPVYRLWRDSRRQRELDSYFTSRIATREALAIWALDATLAMPSAPDPEPKADPLKPSPERLRYLMLRELGKALSEVKRDDFLASHIHFSWHVEAPEVWASPKGEFVRLTHALKQRQTTTQVTYADGKRKEEVLPLDFELRPESIKMVVNGDKGEGADMCVRIHSHGDLNISLVDEATLAAQYVKSGVARRPDSTSITRPVGYCANKNLRVLTTAEDWRAALLVKGIKIPRPQPDETPTHAETLLAIAKAAGVSLICEDFESHKWDQPISLTYGKEITLADALKSFEDQYTWLLDAPNRLIVGWSRLWPERHVNLMPEKLLSGLAEKLDTSGVFIDDAAPLSHYTDDAMFEWLYKSKRLNMLGGCSFGNRKPWQFYDKLGRQDKRLAWSESGLSLAAFDPAYVMDMMGVTNPLLVPHLVMKVKVGSSICLGRFEIRRIVGLKDGTTFRSPMFPETVLKQDIYHIVVEGALPADPTAKPVVEGGISPEPERFSLLADGPAQALPVFSEQIMMDMAKDAGLKWEDMRM